MRPNIARVVALASVVALSACSKTENLPSSPVIPGPKEGAPPTPAMPPTMLPPSNPAQPPPGSVPAAVQQPGSTTPPPTGTPAPGAAGVPTVAGQPLAVPPITAWKPPLKEDELKALDRYAGFSGDGLVLCSVQFSSGAGVPIASFQSSTTNTVEKTVPLTSGDVRAKLAQELADEGFPKPGTPQPIPPQLGTRLQDGQVLVTFGGMPASKLYRPFGNQPGFTVEKVDIVAVSPDGKRVAVRTTGKNGGEFGPPIESRVVTLFE